MPWCPKCKNEYKEGYTTCAECGVELVDELLREDTINEFIDSMKEQTDGLKSDELDEMIESLEETLEDGTCETCVYENSASKAENHKSSAYTLLLIGIAGVIVILLGAFDVLPIHLVGMTKYLTYGVMGTLFVLFIVMGVVSMKSYHIFSKKAESENSVRDTMEKWCLEELNPDEIDKNLGIFEAEISMEEKYFKRTKYLKEILSKKYLNLENNFLDSFIDEIYNDVFND